jgi:hypothetical protein
LAGKVLQHNCIVPEPLHFSHGWLRCFYLLIWKLNSNAAGMNINKVNILVTVPFFSAIGILLIYCHIINIKRASNPMYSIGIPVEFDGAIEGNPTMKYKYWVNEKVYTALTTDFKNDDYAEKFKEHKFIIRFNSEEPQYSVIFLNCEVTDSLEAPNMGWKEIPEEYKDCVEIVKL